MDILFLLVPLSVLLALAVMGLLAWAVGAGQFEDVEREGQRIFEAPEPVMVPATPRDALHRHGQAGASRRTDTGPPPAHE